MCIFGKCHERLLANCDEVRGQVGVMDILLGIIVNRWHNTIMNSLRDVVTLSVLFMSLYFEIFMLITYFEHRKKIRGISKSESSHHSSLPTVTVIVPCFNEENTVGRTLESIFALDYPREKLHIVAVNDGSKDGTMAVLESFKRFANFRVIDKENGGKHTALNLAISQCGTEFVGCLDADSYAKPDSLLRLIQRFDKPDIMAVVPSLHVYSPRTTIQKIQKVEYLIGAFMRSILAELNAMYVTPGPFSIFRREVFDKVGLYKKAHNTEDMEMAMRMQSKGLKIASAHDAVVFTSSPYNIRKLYRQRVRWTSGFLHNVRDYRYMLFNMNYGNIGMFVLPFMILSSFSIIFVIATIGYDLVNMLHAWYTRYQALGLSMFEFTWPSFNWFFMRTTPIMFCGLAAIAAVLIFIVIGSRMSSGNRAKVIEIVSYVCLYSFIAPWWVARSMYNVVFSRQLSWR